MNPRANRSSPIAKVQKCCLFRQKNMTFLDKKLFVYVPDFFGELRTFNPALREFRELEPEVRNGVWDSGIRTFFRT